MVTGKNSMSRLVAKCAKLPIGLRLFVLTWLFGRWVPFLRTAGLHFEQVSPDCVAVSILNRRRVQNHIHSVHATVVALLAETATGFVVAMNIPDDKLMVLKSMNIQYIKRSIGNMRAVATLTAVQRQAIHESVKGNVTVEVVVSDESGEHPVLCEMVWAWLPKKAAPSSKQ